MQANDVLPLPTHPLHISAFTQALGVAQPPAAPAPLTGFFRVTFGGLAMLRLIAGLVHTHLRAASSPGD